MRVAWLAVALGLAMEGLLLLLAAGFGEVLGLKTIVADLVKNVTWAAFVCVGLAVGTTISKIQVPAMGFFGLLAAPLAFEVSRSVHKGTLQALAVVKGVEYRCLGLLVGWIGRHDWGGAIAHALAVRAVFGGTILALMMGAAPGPVPASDLISQGLNELLFSAGALGRRMSSYDPT